MHNYCVVRAIISLAVVALRSLCYKLRWDDAEGGEGRRGLLGEALFKWLLKGPRIAAISSPFFCCVWITSCFRYGVFTYLHLHSLSSFAAHLCRMYLRRVFIGGYAQPNSQYIPAVSVA